MKHTKHIDLLKAMPIFGGLSTETLNFIVQKSVVITISQGDYFFRENDSAQAMYVVLCGQVSILKQWQGTEYPVNILGEGDCFGEIALLDFCPRSASVRAALECTALELHFNHIHDVYAFDSEQFTLINMNIGREVARRLREADKSMLQFKIETSRLDDAGIWHSV